MDLLPQGIFLIELFFTQSLLLQQNDFSLPVLHEFPWGKKE
jgi:hypothetical protein